jgi:hypothetical protein
MRVYLVMEYDRDDALVLRGVFEFEKIARQAVAAGLGTEVKAWEIEEFVPERVTLWTVTASLADGQQVPHGRQVWPVDLEDSRIDELRTLGPGPNRWIMNSLDRERAVAAVTEALVARRSELGVPNA